MSEGNETTGPAPSPTEGMPRDSPLLPFPLFLPRSRASKRVVMSHVALSKFHKRPLLYAVS